MEAESDSSLVLSIEIFKLSKELKEFLLLVFRDTLTCIFDRNAELIADPVEFDHHGDRTIVRVLHGVAH